MSYKEGWNLLYLQLFTYLENTKRDKEFTEAIDVVYKRMVEIEFDIEKETKDEN